MQEKVETQVLGWKNQLLDTGKRNQMINFKDHKGSTLKVLSPDFDEFKYIIGKKSVSFFNIFDKYTEYDEFDDEETEKRTMTIDGFQIEVKDFYKDYEVKPIIDKEQTYSKSVSIYSNLGAKQERKVLRNLKNKSRLFREENAIEILYLAVGMLTWYESIDSNVAIKSPLVLIPVKIEQNGIGDPFKLNLEEEDYLLNDALVKKFKNEFNLDITFEFNSEEGFEDITDYFESVLSKVNDHRWKIDNSIYLGLFSFSKINMVKDLEDNHEEIINNDTIKALSGSNSDFLHETIDLDDEMVNEKMVPENMYQVTDADSSQEKAIQAAILGKSFVLQGPPGTGKSQTITNIISELLARNKKILFVAEKKAALDVVYSNLSKVQLESYALPLHNNKINKKELIQELKLELDKRQTVDKIPKEEQLRIFNQFNDAKIKLSDYAQLLIQKNPPLNKSLYEIYGKYFQLKNIQDIHFDFDLKLIKIPEDFETIKNNLDKIEKIINQFNHPIKESIWWNIPLIQMRSSESKNYLEKINTLYELISQFKESLSFLDEWVNTSETPFIALMLHWQKIETLLNTIPDFNSSLLYVQNLEEELSYLEKSLKTKEKYDTTIYWISENYHEDLVDDINQSLLTELSPFPGFFARLFSNAYRKLKKYLKQNYSKSGSFKRTVFDETTSQLRSYFKYKQKLSQITPNIHLNDLILIPKKSIEVAIKQTKWLIEFRQFKEDTQLLTHHDNQSQFYSSLKSQDLYTFFKSVKHIDETLFSYLKEITNFYQLESLKEVKQLNISEFQKLIMMMIDSYDELPLMIEYNYLSSKTKKYHIDKYLEVILDKGIKSQMKKIFEKMFYFKWIDEIIYQNPRLSFFSSSEQDSSKKLFRESDLNQIAMAPLRIKEIIHENTPLVDGIQGFNKEIMLLNRESSKKRKIMPVRKLFETIPNLILTLKPLVMMSPLSVSTYLKDNAFRFDVVIFDEASQIQPESSLGAIYRAKQSIIVGDKKQLPPTNFFNSIGNEEYIEQDFDIFDSILDVADTIYPSINLEWHYRSKFEELIATSNRYIYKNLITFPSEENPKEYEGITYKYVNHAIYHRGKSSQSTKAINPLEADAVIEEVFNHFKKFGKTRSLGVVTFNSAQQSYIENKINQRRRDSDKFAKYFDSENDEPFFVKNIETVQGDERDTIILNTVYGRDSKGRLSMNFGPINHDQGYRRLNVAITRSKINLIVVTSLHGSDINLSNTSGEGLELLKNFLQYAEYKEDPKVDSFNSDLSFDSEFENEVYTFLTDQGYKVKTQLGVSKYRIDLAIQSPENPSKYTLGIECDGSSYHSSKNARVRDRLRQDVLESRGWTIYRLWSTDWFKNRKSAQEKLIQAVEKSMSKINLIKETPKVNTFNIVTENRVASEINWDIYSNPEIIYQNAKLYSSFEATKNILKELSPVHIETIKKIMPKIYGRAVFSSFVEDKFNQVVKKLIISGELKEKAKFYIYLKKTLVFRKTASFSYKRTFNEIHPLELQVGIFRIIKEAKIIDYENLKKVLLDMTGFMKYSAQMETILQNQLNELERKNYIVLDNKGYSLKKGRKG